MSATTIPALGVRACEGSAVLVGGVPQTATRLAGFLNGLPSWSQELPADRPEGVVVEDAFVPSPSHDPAGPLRSPLPCLVVVALDAASAEVGRGLVVRPAAPPERGDAPEPAEPTGRLVASTLRVAEEAHLWSVTLAGGGATATQYLLRVTFEAPSAGEGVGPFAEVAWQAQRPTQAHAEDPRPSKRARRRLLPPQAWGLPATTTPLDGDCLDAAYVCVVPPDARAVELQCVVSRRGAAAPGSTLLRYALHCLPLGPLTVPPTALLATRATADEDEPQAPMSPRGGSGGRKRAVIVGVSKYSRRPRGDLEYWSGPAGAGPGSRDEDATSWYRYLTSAGYQCVILGDEFSPCRRAPPVPPAPPP